MGRCQSVCGARFPRSRSQRRRPNRSPLPVVLRPRPKRTCRRPPPAATQAASTLGGVGAAAGPTAAHRQPPHRSSCLQAVAIHPSKLEVEVLGQGRASRLPLSRNPAKGQSPGSSVAQRRAAPGGSRSAISPARAAPASPTNQGTAAVPRAAPFLGRRQLLGPGSGLDRSPGGRVPLARNSCGRF